MAVLGGGGSLARLSHSTQKEIKVGDTVVVVACASEKHVGARGVVKRVNSAAAASGQFAYQVEILTEEKQPSARKPPVRWWFSRLQLNPAPKGGIPEKSRGTAEDSQRAAKDPETTADNGLTATVQEDDVPKAAHLALAAERERAEEELALKQKLDALRQRASRSPWRREEVSAERRTPLRRPQSGKPDPRPHSSAKGAQSVKGPQAGKGLRSVGTEQSASPPRRAAGSAPFVLGRPTGALEADPARDECAPLPDVISTAECALLLRELGETAIDEEGVAQITLELDADGSGRIDLRAFLDWWQHHGTQRVFMPDAAAGTAASPPRQDAAPGGASPSARRLVGRDAGGPRGEEEGAGRGRGAPRRRRVAADQQGWREVGEQHETREQTFRRWVSLGGSSGRSSGGSLGGG